ncbi:MAG: thiamine-phosphate kinase [Candidatus Sulfotelmatobacter sp.]|nr:thiamine-phosphate kinase [Candidatus Sulfotelmatobacter sp.]
MVIAEKALIAQIRRLARSTKNPAVVTGIGDDCAILRLTRGRGEEKDTLITTDFSLEGIHFRREWHSPESVGHRCLARGLSDIAAMGGDPVAAFLSLALPRDLTRSWVDRFARSLINLAERYGVTLAGGDTAESPNGILADIVVVGTAPKGKAVLRSRARPGDLIYVSGELGGSAAAVWNMQKGMRKKPNRRPNARDYTRHFFPEPRIELGHILRKKVLASAMIDSSDGLSTDLAHLCEESGVGAEIESNLIPRARIGKPAQDVDLQFALHGGEDYELLFTAQRAKRIPSRIAGIPITRIGRITRGTKILLTRPDGSRNELQPRGWDHFRK